MDLSNVQPQSNSTPNVANQQSRQKMGNDKVNVEVAKENISLSNSVSWRILLLNDLLLILIFQLCTSIQAEFTCP